MSLRELLQDRRSDLRFALRGLSRTPGLTAAIFLTLAFGVGANAAVFSVLDRLMFRPPAGVADPSGIQRLYARNYSAALGYGGEGRVTASVRWNDLVDMGEAARGTARIVGDHSRGARLDGDATPEGGGPPLHVSFVSPGYFSFLGVRAVRGRFFAPDEEQLDHPASVVVVSYALWRRRLEGDSSVIGSTMRLDGTAYTVVGVAPPAFTGLDFMPRDAWVPLAHAGRAWLEQQPVVSLYARFDGRADAQRRVTLEQRLTSQYRRTHDGDRFVEPASRIFLGPLQKALSAARQQTGVPERSLDLLVRLAGMGILVCLLAIANVASLLLLRAMKRRREIGVRLALGIPRSRLVGQFAVESVFLGVGAALVALAVAALTGGVLRGALSATANWPAAVIDARVVMFAVTAAVAVALAAGFAPAAFAFRADITSSLLAAGETRRRRHGRAALLSAQAALCMALLAAAGGFLQSLRRAGAYDRGYDVERNVQIAIRFSPQRVTVTPNAVAVLPAVDTGTNDAQLARIAARLRELPGVEAVGRSFSGLGEVGMPTKVGPNARDTVGVSAQGPFLEFVEPEFVAAAGLRVVDGRALAATDDRAPIIVLNDGLARALFKDRRAVGACVHVREPQSPCRTVVGVVRDVRPTLARDAAYRAYVPLAQAWTAPSPTMVPYYLTARTRGVASAADAARLREAVLPLLTASRATIDVQLAADLLEPELQPWRLAATLFLCLGLLGLATAAVGIYGLVALDVTQQARELGVRLALGASAPSVVRLVVGSSLRSMLVGVGIGVFAALAVGRVMASLLFATSAYDPTVLLGTAITLTMATSIASLIPAWRATRLDPAQVLRAG